MTTPSDDLPISCDLMAIPTNELGAHVARATKLIFQEHEERQELPNGLAWRFTADQYDEVAAYVANERRCCSFYTFTLEVAPAQGPIWLRVTGSEAMKAYLQTELATHGVQ